MSEGIWNRNDATLARSEGWCLRVRDGRMRIERLDELGSVFDGDAAVWRFLSSDQPHHVRAVRFVRRHNPNEFQALLPVVGWADSISP